MCLSINIARRCRPSHFQDLRCACSSVQLLSYYCVINTESYSSQLACCGA